MHEVEDEPLFAERAAGIDIAKAGIEVTVRVPSDTTPGRRQQETRSFATTHRALLELADWLRAWGVARVGMEATGDYWKPVHFVLESAGFDCQLYHAAQVKALPGRPKTDLPIRCGWRGSPSAAACRPVSSRPSRSAACAPTAATASPLGAHYHLVSTLWPA